jgi:hypothetical protein
MLTFLRVTFETPRAERTYEELRYEIALFCAAVRATVDPNSLIDDGTQPDASAVQQAIWDWATTQPRSSRPTTRCHIDTRGGSDSERVFRRSSAK